MDEFSEVRTIIISKSVAITDKLQSSLAHHLGIQNCDIAKSLFEAIEAQPENLYDLFIVHQEFSFDETKLFFADINKVKYADSCVFLRSYKLLEISFDVTSVQEIGFTSAISLLFEKGDIDTIKLALNKSSKFRRLKYKMMKLEHSMQKAFEDIDQAALDWKRGYKREIYSSADKIVRLETRLDEDLKEKYYSQIIEHSITTKIPPEVMELCIPEEILQKKLPGLTENAYQGPSKRAWQRLLKKYGQKK